MKPGIFFGSIVIGFVLFALSGLWTTLFPATSSWTPEKSARSAEVKGKIHNLSFIVNDPHPTMHSGQDLGKLKADYEELKKENDELNAQFTSAAETPQTIAKIFKWSGISLTLLGIIGWYAVNQSR